MIAATYVMLAATSMGLATSPMNSWVRAAAIGPLAEQRRHPGSSPRARNVFHQCGGAAGAA